MPRPRRANIGRRTLRATRAREIRQLESQPERENRVQGQRTRRSAQRTQRLNNIRGIIETDDFENGEVIRLAVKTNCGFSYNARIDYAILSEIGRMSTVCTHCSALKWKQESAGLCCSSGKVRLTPIQAPAEPLRSLIMGEHTLSEHFLSNDLHFNRAFQMTSLGANIITEGNFMPTFKIQGQVYHLIGSLLPEVESQSKFLQIYFISDYEDQVSSRLSHIHKNLDRLLMLELQDMLHRVNPFVIEFKAAITSIPSENQQNYKVIINADRKPVSDHSGRHNAPTTNEVAVVLVDQHHSKRDIVLHTRSNELKRINETHRSYDALQYPLMFCHGQDGYNFEIPILDVERGEEDLQKKVSALQFYCYRLMVRQNQPNYLHRYRQLLNQFFVDMYAKIETERLNFIRFNQAKLRVEDFIHLQDALAQDGNTDNLGRLVYLPSSFTGGPRYMHARTQDGFCYVRKEGSADLLVTMTTNPKWEEISNEMHPGQSAANRHDIVSRVFHLKLKKLMDLFIKDKIFGSVKCYMYSVEWQKRGLPHAHILLWLDVKLRPDNIDDLISAEIPDPEDDPKLHSIIKSHMIHGPCGTLNMQSPCMKEGRCSKRFPKKFVNETVNGDDGYPQYRRRSPAMGGTSVPLKVCGQIIEVDNRWMVPYSPVLSRAFNAHINVEYCCSVKSIKYVCKYINKGSDLATIGLQNKNDEVTRYQSGRYISTSEGIWRILSFPIHERFPPVFPLDVHLENGQRVYFDPTNVRERVQNPRNTTLMAFFQLCQRDDFAKGLLYEEVHSYYTFDKQRRVFQRRRRGAPIDGFPGIFRENVIG